MVRRMLLLFLAVPLMTFSEQFVMQKKKKQSHNQLKEQLAECHADIAQATNTLIRQAADLQEKSHAMLKNISEGKSIDDLQQKLEEAQKACKSLQRCCNDLTKCCH